MDRPKEIFVPGAVFDGDPFTGEMLKTAQTRDDDVCYVLESEVERLREDRDIFKSGEYGITAAQYHAGLDKLWKALAISCAQGRDVFTLCSERIAYLESEVGVLRTQLKAWKDAFGTAQLTHALARLEKAESGVERLNAKLERVGEWKKNPWCEECSGQGTITVDRTFQPMTCPCCQGEGVDLEALADILADDEGDKK